MEIEHYSYVLCLILVLWVMSAISLYKEYKNSLRASLDGASIQTGNDEKRSVSENFRMNLSEMNSNSIIGMLKVIKRTDAMNYGNALVNAYQIDSEDVKKYVEHEIIAGLHKQTIEEIEKTMSSKSAMTRLRKEVESSMKSGLSDLNRAIDLGEQRRPFESCRSFEKHISQESEPCFTD